MSSRYTSAFRARRGGKQKAPRPPTSHPLSAFQATEYESAEILHGLEKASSNASAAASDNSKHATAKDESQKQRPRTQFSGHTTTFDAHSHQSPSEDQESYHAESLADLTFDDSNAEVIHGSDSSLEWDQAPFDYVVPMHRPMYHERYAFERGESSSLIEQAGAASRRLIRTISETSDGIGRAFAAGSSQAVGTGEQAMEYLHRAGDGVGTAVKHGRKAVKSGLELIKESSRALPALQSRLPKKAGK